MAINKSITHLKVGDKAPPVKAKDQYGKTFTFNDVKDKKIALYFYPNDDTETCTKEACKLKNDSKPFFFTK